MQLEILKFPKIGGANGYLTPLESQRNIPFEIKRVYYVYGTPSDVRRGFHAHKKTRQVAICLSGSCRFHMDDGKEKQTVVLDANTDGLLIEPMIWHEMDGFTTDCILLVFADDYYDESDYIRSYENFLGIANSH